MIPSFLKLRLRDNVPLRMVLVSIVAFCCLLGINRWYAAYLPEFSDATMSASGKPAVSIEIPLYMTRVPVPSAIDLRFHMSLRTMRLTSFLVLCSGDLVNMSVNGLKISPNLFHTSIDLSDILHQGSNDIVMRLATNDPFAPYGMAILPSNSNVITRMYGLSVLALILLWAFVCLRILRDRVPLEVRIPLVLGIVLRVIYQISIPPYVLSYDWVGHMEYIKYVAIFAKLPLHTGLWESHQAPLYYLLAAIPVRIGWYFGWPSAVIDYNLQSLSLLLSVGTLFVGSVVIARTFQNSFYRILGVLLLATAPSLMYLTSQVSNDVLLTFFGFLWYASLERSLVRPSSKSWVLVSFWIALGMLTKANAMPWLLASFVCLALASPSWKAGFRSSVSLATCVPVWVIFYGWRFWSDKTFGIVANAHLLSSAFKMHAPAWSFFVFNPFAVLIQPYMKNVSGPFRPEYFFESLLRSSQFGISSYGKEGVYLLFYAMLLLPVILLGVIDCFRSKRWLPVVAICMLFLALAAYVVSYPYVSVLHFRFIVTAVLPLVLCLLFGCALLPRYLRIFAEMTILIYVLISTIFFGGLAW